MRIEHVALNVGEPTKLAQWLVDNLGMRVVRKFDVETDTQFVADSAGATVIELYHNKLAPVPDYASMDPLELHVAFTVDDVGAVRDRLIGADATAEGEIVVTPDGDELAMVREPGGLAIQLMKRAEPML